MRKVFLIAVAAMLVVGSAQAQFKPEKGSFGLEVQFRPLAAQVIQTTEFDLEQRSPLGVSAWYFCVNRLELRADLGFGFGSNKTKTEDPDKKNDEVNKLSTNAFGLALGANYHFGGTARISPYVGARLGLGLANRIDKTTNLNHVSGDSDTEKRGFMALGVALTTGFNWFIVDGLYLGAEIGLGVDFTLPGATKTINVRGGQKDTNKVKPTTSSWDLGFFANPAIRLGWKF